MYNFNILHKRHKSLKILISFTYKYSRFYFAVHVLVTMATTNDIAGLVRSSSAADLADGQLGMSTPRMGVTSRLPTNNYSSLRKCAGPIKWPDALLYTLANRMHSFV